MLCVVVLCTTLAGLSLMLTGLRAPDASGSS
jgi:hypothetical protein